MSRASKLSGPSPPIASTCFRSGSEGCRSRSIFSNPKPRNSLGTTISLLRPCASMNESSRSRKMCISGFITAPIREQARYISVNSHQFGSWQDTTSFRPTPSRERPTAILSANVATSR